MKLLDYKMMKSSKPRNEYEKYVTNLKNFKLVQKGLRRGVKTFSHANIKIIGKNTTNTAMFFVQGAYIHFFLQESHCQIVPEPGNSLGVMHSCAGGDGSGTKNCLMYPISRVYESANLSFETLI